MEKKLTRNDVARLIDDLRKAVAREECWTCDCLQGFLTQLEIDAEEDAAAIVDPLKVPTAEMHGCLGCDPCPPGQAFSQYIILQQRSSCAKKNAGC